MSIVFLAFNRSRKVPVFPLHVYSAGPSILSQSVSILNTYLVILAYNKRMTSNLLETTYIFY